MSMLKSIIASSMVEGIETGGVSEQDLIKARIAGTWPSGDLVLYGEVNDKHTYACNGANITSLTLQNSTVIPGRYNFCNCSNLKIVLCPEAKEMHGKAFIGCGALEEFYAPKLESAYADQMIEGSKIEKLEFPCFNSYIYDNSFRFNKLLKYADFGLAIGLWNSCFYGCNILSHLVLRKTDAIASLSAPSPLGDTPFMGYNDLVGYCYVPRALISEYQQATNWAALHAAGTCIFKPLEDYTIDGTTTGEMDWAKIEGETA